MSKNDEQIKKLLEAIDKKREKLGTKPRMNLKTNGLLKAAAKTVNINTVNSLDDCIHIVADIISINDSYVKAAELLEIGNLAIPTYSGFAIEDWIDDFKLKAKIIKWSIEDKKIKALESKLKNLRSEDLKTADELDDITKALS